MKIWRLKKGSDRRFRQGHPWIFASELGHSSKEVMPGEVVELRDSSDHFLAFGYAHPTSQICFRRLSSRAQDRDVLSPAFFRERLERARQLRQNSGWCEVSHRWLYGEADGTPGLIVDAFRLASQRWVVVAQASTAGMDRALPALFEALSTFEAEVGELTLIEAPSSKSRTLEGLKLGDKQVRRGDAAGLGRAELVLQQGLTLHADLLGGQKTGFFLDQQWNALLLRRKLENQFRAGSAKPVHVLDICCYVGQWSAHATQAITSVGREVSVSLFDSSEAALQLAQSNLQRNGAREVTLHLGDALTDLGELPAGRFDLVICDPPAFVKKRADLPSGLTAYTKLMRDAIRAVAPGGVFVASSCSGLVKGEDWREVLVQAAAKASRTFKIVTRGGHGPDHPVRPEFPEGEYLKCEIGQIDYPY